jgi:hypothetical protein
MRHTPERARGRLAGVLTSRAPPVVCALFNPAPPPPSERVRAYQGLIDVSHLAHVSDYTPYKSVPHISLLLDFPISHQPLINSSAEQKAFLYGMFVDQQLASNKHLVV